MDGQRRRMSALFLCQASAKHYSELHRDWNAEFQVLLEGCDFFSAPDLPGHTLEGLRTFLSEFEDFAHRVITATFEQMFDATGGESRAADRAASAGSDAPRAVERTIGGLGGVLTEDQAVQLRRYALPGDLRIVRHGGAFVCQNVVVYCWRRADSASDYLKGIAHCANTPLSVLRVPLSHCAHYGGLTFSVHAMIPVHIDFVLIRGPSLRTGVWSHAHGGQGETQSRIPKLVYASLRRLLDATNRSEPDESGATGIELVAPSRMDGLELVEARDGHVYLVNALGLLSMGNSDLSVCPLPMGGRCLLAHNDLFRLIATVPVGSPRIHHVLHACGSGFIDAGHILRAFLSHNTVPAVVEKAEPVAGKPPQQQHSTVPFILGVEMIANAGETLFQREMHRFAASASDMLYSASVELGKLMSRICGSVDSFNATILPVIVSKFFPDVENAKDLPSEIGAAIIEARNRHRQAVILRIEDLCGLVVAHGRVVGFRCTGFVLSRFRESLIDTRTRPLAVSYSLSDYQPGFVYAFILPNLIRAYARRGDAAGVERLCNRLVQRHAQSGTLRRADQYLAVRFAACAFHSVGSVDEAIRMNAAATSMNELRVSGSLGWLQQVALRCEAARMHLAGDDYAAAARIFQQTTLYAEEQVDDAGLQWPLVMAPVEGLLRCALQFPDRTHRIDTIRATAAEVQRIAEAAIASRLLYGAIASIGYTLFEASAFEEAAVVLSAAVPVCRRAFGGISSVTAAALNALGFAYYCADREQFGVRAVQTLREALNIIHISDGQRSAGYATAVHNLVLVLVGIRWFKAADNLLAETMGVFAQISGAPGLHAMIAHMKRIQGALRLRFTVIGYARLVIGILRAARRRKERRLYQSLCFVLQRVARGYAVRRHFPWMTRARRATYPIVAGSQSVAAAYVEAEAVVRKALADGTEPAAFTSASFSWNARFQNVWEMDASSTSSATDRQALLKGLKDEFTQRAQSVATAVFGDDDGGASVAAVRIGDGAYRVDDMILYETSFTAATRAAAAFHWVMHVDLPPVTAPLTVLLHGRSDDTRIVVQAAFPYGKQRPQLLLYPPVSTEHFASDVDALRVTGTVPSTSSAEAIALLNAMGYLIVGSPKAPTHRGLVGVEGADGRCYILGLAGRGEPARGIDGEFDAVHYNTPCRVRALIRRPSARRATGGELEVVDLARRFSQSLSNLFPKAHVLNVLALRILSHALAGVGQTADAVQFIEEGVRLAAAGRWLRLQIRSLSLLGIQQVNTSALTSAEATFRRALELDRVRAAPAFGQPGWFEGTMPSYVRLPLLELLKRCRTHETSEGAWADVTAATMDQCISDPVHLEFLFVLIRDALQQQRLDAAQKIVLGAQRVALVIAGPTSPDYARTLCFQGKVYAGVGQSQSLPALRLMKRALDLLLLPCNEGKTQTVFLGKLRIDLGLLLNQFHDVSAFSMLDQGISLLEQCPGHERAIAEAIAVRDRVYRLARIRLRLALRTVFRRAQRMRDERRHRKLLSALRGQAAPPAAVTSDSRAATRVDSLELLAQREAAMRDQCRRQEACERSEVQVRADISQDATEGRLWMWSIFCSLQPTRPAALVPQPPAMPAPPAVPARSTTTPAVTPPRLSSGAPTEGSDQLVPQGSGGHNRSEPHSASDLLVVQGNNTSLSGSVLIQMGGPVAPVLQVASAAARVAKPTTWLTNFFTMELQARLELEEVATRAFNEITSVLSVLMFRSRHGHLVSLASSFGQTMQRLERPMIEEVRAATDDAALLPTPEPMAPRKPETSATLTNGRVPRKSRSSAKPRPSEAAACDPSTLEAEENVTRQTLIDDWASKWRRIVRTARARAA